jgi:hypothetical protein
MSMRQSGFASFATLWLVLGCGIDELKVKSYADGGNGGESGKPEADGGKGDEAGKGGSNAGSSGKRAGGEGGTGGAGDAGGHSGNANGSGGAGKAGAGGAAGAAAIGGDLLSAFTAVAEMDCGKIAQCGPFVFNAQFGDMQTCRTRRMLIFSWIATLPGVGWTPPKVAACKAVIEAQSCRQYVDDDGQPECLVAGTRQNGEACSWREQCASRFCSTSGYDCGTCAAAPSEGASCIEDNDCPDRTVCGCPDGSGACTQPLCVRPRNDGEACSIGTPCGYGLNCLIDGRCHAAPNQANSPCSPADGVQCDVFTQGLVCSNNACLKLTAADTCSATTYCRQRNSICDANTGACSAPPTDTGPCADGDSCAFPALCVAGSCQLPGAGAQCQ